MMRLCQLLMLFASLGGQILFALGEKCLDQDATSLLQTQTLVETRGKQPVDADLDMGEDLGKDMDADADFGTDFKDSYGSDDALKDETQMDGNSDAQHYLEDATDAIDYDQDFDKKPDPGCIHCKDCDTGCELTCPDCA